MHTESLSENLLESGHLEVREEDGRIALKWILGK